MVTVVGKDMTAVKEVTCRGCASRLQYTSHEVQSEWHRDYTGSSDEFRFIVCPSCGHKQAVKGY